jgi:hypothetical protein
MRLERSAHWAMDKIEWVLAPEFHNMALLPSLLTNNKASDNIKNNTFFKMENRWMPRKVYDLRKNLNGSQCSIYNIPYYIILTHFHAASFSEFM